MHEWMLYAMFYRQWHETVTIQHPFIKYSYDYEKYFTKNQSLFMLMCYMERL